MMKLQTLIVTCVAVLLFGVDASASIYATEVAYFQGSGLSDDSRGNPLNSLGSNDALAVDMLGNIVVSNINFLSLGKGGSAVFSFGDQEFTGKITIYETTWGRSSYPSEDAQVWVGTNDILNDLGNIDLNSNAWELAASFSSKDADSLGEISLDVDGIFSYLKIVDTTVMKGGDGVDINAVAVNPTPIPGAFILFASGVVCLFTVRHRK